MTTSPAPSSRALGSTALAGIGLMLTGVFLFSLNDANGKWLVATYTVGEILLIRSVIALVLLSPIIYRTGFAAFRNAPRPGLQVLRIVCSTIEVALFFLAVAFLPLADVMTFYLATPIYVTALSALLLNEHVGWRRWTAVLIGFCGVLLALRPSAASFTLPALIALLGSIFFACLLIVTRLLRATPDIVLMSGQIFGTLVFGLIVAPFGWITPPLSHAGLLLAFGLTAVVAVFCVNRSLKIAPASIVVPYQYTMIVWGVLLGYLVFGDVPDRFTLAGAAIIVAAGLFIFWREQVRARAPEPPSRHFP